MICKHIVLGAQYEEDQNYKYCMHNFTVKLGDQVAVLCSVKSVTENRYASRF